MAKLKNRRDNHNIKRPKSHAGYGESAGTREMRERSERKAPERKPAGRSASERRPSASGNYKDRGGRREFEERENDSNIIIGRNPVTEALKAGREVDKLLVTSREGSMIKILALAKEQGIPVMYVEKAALDRIAQGKAHQGVCAYVSPYDYSTVDDILANAAERDEDPFIIILDGLEDPHNLGAIMRTAECAGAHGIIIPKRHSCGLTETVAKASAGAIEYMPVAKVTNIAQTIDELKDRGIWVAACDMGGAEYYRTDMAGKIAVVIGSEGFGVSKLVKEKCDFVVSMPMVGKITSLNASNAVAVVIYEIRKQRDTRSLHM
ncbi:MAG: 23S rRNA (guanosine(2251)-2'-O)-methyltransferase RlmB [Firmicutes bacterium]|nr:23S rRNA (guanosine(2251)-2'-O)-methyltransferase RlmB [Bacillota bacterium]